MKTKLGVLTGGPCAGKTTVTGVISSEWPTKLIVAPEVASVLLEHLMPKPGSDFDAWLRSLQQAIVPTQRSCEESQLRTATERGASIVICDRGILDGAAYVPGGMPRFSELCSINPEDELARYEFVIHLESVATANPLLWDELKATNPARYETLAEAIEREMALREVYKSHPKYHFVSGSEGIESVIRSVEAILGEILDTEIERKWHLKLLPKNLDLSAFRSVPIRQGYLTDPKQKSELRIRQIGTDYFITVKGGKGLVRKEWERPFPRSQFEALWSCTEGRRIEKVRYFIPHGENLIEFDVFEGSNRGLILFESEFNSPEEAIIFELPGWAAYAIDVTADEEFKNKFLAS